MKYTLEDGEHQHQMSPETFWIPDSDFRHSIPVGCFAKLIFNDGDNRERMWVKVIRVEPNGYVGSLANSPSLDLGLEFGSLVTFQAKHVIDLNLGEG